MRRKTIFLVLVILIAGSPFVQAQDDFPDSNYQETIIPASPTVAALGSYGFAPVNLSTGAVNISIPIYTLLGSDLTLPISMNYRPGVKVYDLSPYTGMGWSLFGGGVITRNISSRPDGIVPRLPFDFDAENPLSYDDAQEFAQIGGDLDGGSDIYIYNFAGLSGQFALNEDYSIYYIHDYRNWDFSFSESEIVIIDQNGTKYIFSTIERTTSSTYDSEGNEVDNDPIVSWHLTSIISSTTDERIDFNYYNETIVDQRRDNNQLLLDAYGPGTTYTNDLNDFETIVYATKKLESIILSRNSVQLQKVVFEALEPRDDLITNTTNDNAFALSKISIYGRENTPEPLKYFEFDISSEYGERMYLNSIQEFSGDGQDSFAPYTFNYYEPDQLPSRFSNATDYWGYYSSNGSEFAYQPQFKEETVSFKTKLPSFPQARYGSLKTITFPTGGVQEFFYELNGFGASVPNYNTHTLELNKFSNGWKNGDYNLSNEEEFIFTLSNGSLIEIDATLQLQVDLSPNYFGSLVDEVGDHIIEIVNMDTSQTHLYVSFYGEGGNDEIDQIFSTTATSSPGEYLDVYYETDTNIFNIGGAFKKKLSLSLSAGTYKAKIKTASPSNINNYLFGKARLDISIQDGWVDVEVPVDGIRIAHQTLLEDDDIVREINYSYNKYDENGIDLNIGSGQILGETLLLDISQRDGEIYYRPENEKLTSYTNNNDVRIHHDPVYSAAGAVCRLEYYGDNGLLYECTTHLNQWRSTALHSIPKFANYTRLMYEQVKVEEIGNGFTIHSFYGRDLASGNGYNKKVFSIYRANWAYDENNNVVYTDGPAADKTDDGGGDGISVGRLFNWPYSGAIEQTALRGRQKTITHFSETPSFQKISEESFEYQEYIQEKTYQIPTISARNGFAMFYGITEIPNDAFFLKEKKITTYDLGSTNYVENKTIYNYDNDLHLPNEIITIGSQSKKMIRKFKYSSKYANTNLGFGSTLTTQELVDKNIIVPIEEQLWEERGEDGDYYLIGGVLNIFDKVDPSNGANELIQRSKLIGYKAGNGNTYNAEYFSNSYNNVDWFSLSDINDNLTITDLIYYPSGNLKQALRENGTPITYIWGYDYQYLIAKIENATYNDVENLSEFGLGFIISESLSAAQESQLRNQLPNAMITTYTYNPLIGITSQTDPRGYTMNYVYDNLNRLEYVKDQDGKVYSKNEYNYRTNN